MVEKGRKGKKEEREEREGGGKGGRCVAFHSPFPPSSLSSF